MKNNITQLIIALSVFITICIFVGTHNDLLATKS